MTSPDNERQEPMLDVARGDPAVSRHLRDCLRLLRERSDDPSFQRLVDDVLRGRRGLREVCRSPEFAAVLDGRVAQFAPRLDELSDDERARLAERGNRYLSDLREQMGTTRDRERPQGTERG